MGHISRLRRWGVVFRVKSSDLHIKRARYSLRLFNPRTGLWQPTSLELARSQREAETARHEAEAKSRDAERARREAETATRVRRGGNPTVAKRDRILANETTQMSLKWVRCSVFLDEKARG